MNQKLLYHGWKEMIEFPEIRTTNYHKDFYFGFYCTEIWEQANRWALRFMGKGISNEYQYTPNGAIFNYVQNFVDGKISREAFWELAKYKKPTHQISFHTARALATLQFVKGYGICAEQCSCIDVYMQPD